MRSRLIFAALCLFLAAGATVAQELAAQKSVANGVTVRATRGQQQPEERSINRPPAVRMIPLEPGK